MVKMESHEHKRLLEEIRANRIASLELRLRLNPNNKLIKEHLDRIKKKQWQQINH